VIALPVYRGQLVGHGCEPWHAAWLTSRHRTSIRPGFQDTQKCSKPPSACSMPDCGTQAVPPAAAPLAPSDASRVELPCFQADTCHVHVNIPPCDTLGHRADSWNVAKPDYTCELRGFTRGDTFLLRLLTQDAGELFAEATWEPDRPMATVRCLIIHAQRFVLHALNASHAQCYDV
jgi:Protein of unknown function (DUF1681)